MSGAGASWSSCSIMVASKGQISQPETGSWVSHTMGAATWSRRCWPTCGRSAITAMPCSRKCSAGPRPDTIISCGVWIDPQASTTALRRMDGAARCFSPHGPAILDDEAGGHAFGPHLEMLGQYCERMQIGHGRGLPQPAPGIEREEAHALSHLPPKSTSSRPSSMPGVDEAAARRVAGCSFDGDGVADALPVGCHRRGVPARSTQALPLVEVRVRRPDEGAVIVVGAAAQQLRTGIFQYGRRACERRGPKPQS